MKRRSYHLTLLAAAAVAQAGIAFAQASDNGNSGSATQDAAHPARTAAGPRRVRPEVRASQHKWQQRPG